MNEFLLNPLTVSLAAMQTFLLVFLRISGMFLRAPLFGSDLFPMKTRAVLSFCIAIVMFPVVQNAHGHILMTESPGTFLAACMSEMTLGLVIGFVAQMLLYGLMMAGHVMDTEMSFSLATVFDPITSQNSSLLSQLVFLGGTVMFFMMDGHLHVLKGLAFSFERIPLAGADFSGSVFWWILTKLAPQIFVIALVFAAPVMAGVFLSTVGIALMARVVPEMNVFAFAFPVRIGVGFIFLDMSMNYLLPVTDRIVNGTVVQLAQVIGRMS
ncbi:MAG: flagellar biosynthetic protein FliR [Planctomycetota bacterium]